MSLKRKTYSTLFVWIFYALMGVKAEVSSRPAIWRLTQAVYLMISAPDILGIECRVLI
jgi:hypothetical protein